jgi:hypothetical protein
VLAATSGVTAVLGAAAVLWIVAPFSSSHDELVVTPGSASGPPPTVPATAPPTVPATAPPTVVVAPPTGAVPPVVPPTPSIPFVTPTTLVETELQSAPPVIAIDGIGVRIQVPDPAATTGRTIRVLDATSDRSLGEIALPDEAPFFPYLRDEPVSAADLTGDGVADYLMPYGPAAQGPVGLVLSNDGGTWHLVPFAGLNGFTEIWVGIQPRIRPDGRLESIYRSCDPNCAEGLTEYRPWSYHDGVFVQDPGPS